MRQRPRVFSRRISAFLFLACLVGMSGPAAGQTLPTRPGRIEILGWQDYFGTTGTMFTRQPSHTFTNYRGDTVSLQVTPVVPGVIDYQGNTVTLAEPLVIKATITARRSYAAVGGTVSIEMRVGEPFEPDTLCTRIGPSKRIPAGGADTLTAELSCSFGLVHTFNQSYDTSRVTLDINVSIKEQLDGAATGGESFFLAAHLYRRENQDQLILNPTSPSPPLSVRPVQTFAGTLFRGLGTVDTAVATVYVIDQDGKTAGTSAPITFNLNKEISKPYTISNVRLPQKDGPVRIYAVLSDTALTKELATASATYTAYKGCDLGGTITQEITSPDPVVNALPDARVEILDADEDVLASTQARLAGSVKSPSSTYCFLLAAPPDPTKKYRLRLLLQDGLTEPTDLLVSDDPPIDLPGARTYAITTESFTIPGSKVFDVHLPTENIGKNSVAAAAYWAYWRQGHLLTPATVHAGFRPGRLNVFLTDSKTYPLYCLEPNAAIGCLSVTSAYLVGHDQTLGVRQFVERTAGLLYGEHVVGKLYGPLPSDPGSPSDPLARSPALGFSMFWALHSDQILKTGVYKAGLLDSNARVEEDAREGVGTLLWDLYDSHSDVELVTDDVSGGFRVDEAILEMRDITRVLAEDRPKDLRELHAKLLARPYHLDLPLSIPNGLSVLDNVYRLHLNPNDVLPTSRAGRAAAASGSIRPAAVSLPPDGSFIDVTLVDGSGRPVPATRIDIRFAYGAGAEGLDGTSSRTIGNGLLDFEMPPKHYDVRAFLSVPGSDQPPLVIENAAYWSSVPNTNGSFLSHTFVVPDVPQVDGLLPNAARVGARVRILGRAFSPATGDNAVTFGAARAAVISASPNELVVEVPRTLTRGPVSVTVAVAGKTSNAAPYTIEAPVLSVPASAVSWGAVAVGQFSEKTLKVGNTGDAPLEITGAASTSADFSTSLFVAPASLEPGEEREIAVRFTPAAPGTRSGTLVLSTNDNVHRTATVNLTGTGTAETPRGLVFTPGALGFGGVALNQARVLVVSIRNASSAPRTVSAAASTLAALRLVSPAPPFTLAAGEARDLTVELKPTSIGVLYGSLLFTTDDPLTPQISLAVQGEGVSGTPPACGYGVTPASVSFPAEGGSAVVSVTATAGCAWTSSAAGSSFASITGGATGSGSATITAARSAEGPRASTVTIAGLLVEVRQEGAAVGSETFVPIVLSTAGLGGTFFSSELTLTNRGASPVLVELTYTAAFGGGGGTARDVIPAGGQLVFADALQYLRSIGVDIPATGNRGGTLRVRYLDASTTTATATVRTASIVPEGRAGLAYGGVPRSAQLTGTAYLTGLRQDAADRTNVAILNTGTEADGGLSYRVTVFSGDPAKPGTKVFEESLPPGGFRQFTEILRDLPFTQGYAKVERTGGRAPFTCYAVINDRANGDGSFVPPVSPEALTGKAGLTLPVAVEAGPFDSEVVATNFGTSARTVTLTFVADAITSAGNSASLPLTLAAGEQRILPRFVDVLRRSGAPGIGAAGSATFAGAVFLSVASGDVAGLSIGARTSSPGGGGKYGLFYTGVQTGAGATGSAWLFGLQQNAENRTNIAIVNTGDVNGSGSDYGITIFDGDTGRNVAYVAVNGLGARRWTQISGILASRAPGVTNAYAQVTRISGANPFIAYAVINDGGAPGQRTGDGAFVAMELP